MRRSSARWIKTRSSIKPENEGNTDPTAQFFQITVNVVEAMKLVWHSPNTASSYVVVVLGKKKFRTNVCKNSTEPNYSEHFIFEMYANIRDLLRSTVWLAVMEPRCYSTPRLLGEANIELAMIWAEPRHQVFHKWAQLILPHQPNSGLVGFIKVDISILSRGDVQIMPAVLRQKQSESFSNLLLPSGVEQQRANYLISILGAYALPFIYSPEGKRTVKPPNTFVRISFCGLTAKTGVQHHTINPVYGEQFSIIEMFPNTCQGIRFEICSEGSLNKVYACTHLNFNLVSHDGENGFLPTFGPSLLHMYGNQHAGTLSSCREDGPYYRGALLVALKIVVPYNLQGFRSFTVEPIAPIKLDNMWMMEDFIVYCPILEISMVDRRVVSKSCGVAITMGEVSTDNGNDNEFSKAISEIKSRKLYYTGQLGLAKSKPSCYGYVDFPTAYPVLQLAVRLPDATFQMYRNNMVHRIIHGLESHLTEIETRLKSFNYTHLSQLLDDFCKATDVASGSILKFLDIIQYCQDGTQGDNWQQTYTDLDQKRLQLQKDELKKIYMQIGKQIKLCSEMTIDQTATRKSVKTLLAESRDYIDNLRWIIFKFPECWPDIVVLLLSGNTRIAYCKISPSDVIYSVISEQNGRNCGQIQTLYLRPLKCRSHLNTPTTCKCVVGKVELLLWMGLYRQMKSFETFLPKDYEIAQENMEMSLKCSVLVLECRFFICRAKFNVVLDDSAGYTIRINALNCVKESKPVTKCPTPVWNQLLKIRRVTYNTIERLRSDPPTFVVEIIEAGITVKDNLYA